jgi:DNA-binding transcriptional ArsR family regulator
VTGAGADPFGTQHIEDLGYVDVQDEPVVAIARVLTHRVCLRLIDELEAGEATVSDLSARLGEPQPSISSHLGLLRGAGLVEAEARGRQRAYRLRGAAPAEALSTLRSLAEQVGARDDAPLSAEKPADAPIRLARACYDHLAGRAGVELLDRLVACAWLAPAGEGEYEVTDLGRERLAGVGVDVEAARRARRRFAFACPDWTEHRPHLGGALGAAIFRALDSSGHVRRQPGSRVVRVRSLPWPE